MSLIKKYLNTVTTLYKSPRQVIDSFLHGEYAQFLHPLIFCLTGAIIVVLINSLSLDFTIEPDISGIQADSEVIIQLTEWTQTVSVWAATQFLPLSMILLMIVSLSLGGALFLREKTNGFFDHLSINAYSVGASIVVLPLLIPVWGFSGQPLTDPFINSTVPGMVIAGAVLWIYNIYFRPSGFMDWIRILSAYVTGFVVYVLLSGLASSVLGYVIFAINRLSEISA